METPKKDQSADENMGTPQKQDSTSGYLLNITSPSDESRFHFMVQGKRKSVNFVCFDPPKKRQLMDLLGSPVKVTNPRESKRSTDLILSNESSVTVVGNLDFEVLNMQNLKILDLQKVAVECLVTLTATVTSRSKQMESNAGLIYQTLSACDETGVIKIMMWGESFVDVVEEKKTYKFVNMRVKLDKKYGSLYLGTTKSENTEIVETNELTNLCTTAVDVEHVPSIRGEIIMVQKSPVDYLNCKKCKKRIEGNVTGNILFCKTCDGHVKKNRCKQMRVVHLEFEEEKNEKLHHLSLFSSVMDKMLNTDTASLPVSELQNRLLMLPPMSITVSNKAIQTFEFSQ